ncbi:MAG: cytosine permease, partial [Gammaproteobacteria bacterium]|nr:cytosine permease [Gammaproteobacteria bacterium]
RGYVASYNKIGLIAMWLPTSIGVVMGSGKFGTQAQALSVPLAGVAAFFMPACISGFMSRRSVISQYFARIPESVAALETVHECPLCREPLHRSDFVLCPFHGGKFICSRCCATDASCQTVCHGERVPPKGLSGGARARGIIHRSVK